MFQEETRRELLERLTRLTPLEPSRWGTMNAPKMVCHLLDAMRMSLGEMAVASKGAPLRFPPLKQLAIYWMPMPKGLPTAPELLTRVPAEWTADVAALAAAFDRFGARSQIGRWPDHPTFGPMTGRAWGALMYRHTDHHFRQFGI